MRRVIVVLAVAAVPAAVVTGTMMDAPVASGAGSTLAQTAGLRASAADAAVFSSAPSHVSSLRHTAAGDPAALSPSWQARAGGPAGVTLAASTATVAARTAARPVARAPPACGLTEGCDASTQGGRQRPPWVIGHRGRHALHGADKGRTRI